MKEKRVFLSLITWCMICLFGMSVNAADTTQITINPQYGQTEARKMLDMINAFRTGDDAWYWNADDTTKTTLSGLKEFAYDYDLEKIAMQRAAEIAVYWSHTRPNGEACYSAYTGIYVSNTMGENIAAGTRTASSTFALWQEANEKYSGQGHRRNMLNNTFTAIGIGHVTYGGYDFWVQEFGNRRTIATMTTPIDTYKQVTIDVLASNILNRTITTEKTALTMKYEEMQSVPNATVTISFAGTWPANKKITVLDPIVYTVANDTIATISENQISAKKVGTTKIELSATGTTAEVSLTVEPADIKSAVVNLEGTSFTYSKAPVIPEITSVVVGGATLTENSDYTVKYQNNTDAGDATIIITGIGNYTGTVTKTFTILPADIGATKAETIDNQIYTGQELRPGVVVKDGEDPLTTMKDYTVSYRNNTKAGDATAIITGTGNYAGEKEVPFKILPKELNAANVTAISDQEYTGAEIIPAISAKDGTLSLEDETDFSVTCNTNLNVGTANAVITFNGNYTGTVVKSFKIIAKTVTEKNSEIKIAEGSIYDGTEQKPVVTVELNGKILEADTDYVLSYQDNIAAGNEAKAALIFARNYTGTVTKAFTILPADIGAAKAEAIDNQTYTGQELRPGVVVKDGEDTLTTMKDYTVSYRSNTKAGDATAIITGTGNYAGEKEVPFKILPKELNEANVADISDQKYTGAEIIPTISAKDGILSLEDETDFSVTCNTNLNVGTANAVITFKGNYTGTIAKSFKIVQRELSIEDVTIEIAADSTYDGTEQKPVVTVKFGEKILLPGDNYSVSYLNNINAGEKAEIRVQFNGNYKGTVSKYFTVQPRDISNVTISSIEDRTFCVDEIMPDTTVTDGAKSLELKKDYTVQYSNNVNVGQATVSVTGEGNYTGNKEITFKITPKELNEDAIEKIEDQEYTGKSIIPDVMVKNGPFSLAGGADYELKCTNNENLGTAEAKFVFKGNYTGTVTKTFEIIAKTVTEKNSEIKITEGSTYDGTEQKPVVTVELNGKTLEAATDYVLSYQDNIAAGNEAKAVLIFAGNYTGTVTKAFQIQSKSVTGIVIRKISDQEYSGQELKPAVTLENSSYVEGTDYTVSYKNNMNEGTATATVTFKGNYEGIYTTTFTIRKPATPTTPTSPGQFEKTISVTVKAAGYKHGFKTIALKKGKTVNLKGTALPVTAMQGVTFESSNTKVATVSDNGKVKAKNPGTAEIKILSKDQTKSKIITIKVLKNDRTNTNLSVSKKTLTIKKGNEVQIKIKSLTKDTTSKITYKSKKKSVATVDTYGVVTGKKKGTTYVTVKCGKKSVNVMIKVK